jgi:hypothetical protein
MRTGFTIADGLMLGLLDCVTGDTVAITANRATVAQAGSVFRARAPSRKELRTGQVVRAQCAAFLSACERFSTSSSRVFCSAASAPSKRSRAGRIEAMPCPTLSN